MTSIYLYIIVSCLVVYLIRALPMLIFKKPIKNTFIRSFLYYVPYVTLAVMTVPEIFYVADGCLWAGIGAFIVGVVVAFFTRNLFIVASSCCVVCLIIQLFVQYVV